MAAPTGGAKRCRSVAPRVTRRHRFAPGDAAERPRFMEALARGRGVVGPVMYSYLSGSWFDNEAIAWASRGIEAGAALAWKELGLTRVEAEQRANGVTGEQAAVLRSLRMGEGAGS